MNATAVDVKKLRDETGATFADCKSALTEAQDWEDALKILEARNSKKAEMIMTAGRETKQGGIFSYVHHNNSLGVLLEINCSTDFVARSDAFRQLASDLGLQIAGASPKYVSLDSVPADVIEEARRAINEDPSMARVPAEKREEVISNKLKKTLGEQVLLLQPWVKDEAVTVSDLVRKVSADTGEAIVVRRFTRYALGE